MVRKLGLTLIVILTVTLAACSSTTSPPPASSTSSTSTSTTIQAPTTTTTQTTIATTILPRQDVDGVKFLNSRVGWATTQNHSRLFMTSDGGLHWRAISPPMLARKGMSLASGLSGASFISASDFYVSVYDASAAKLEPVLLFHTTDAGTHWTQAGSFPNFVDGTWVNFLNKRRGWVAVDNGEAGGSGSVTIYETTNGGRNWQMVSRSRSLTGAPGTPGNPGMADVTGLSVEGSSRSPILWLSGATTLTPYWVCSTDGGRRWTGCGGGWVDPCKGSGGGAWPPVFSSRLSGALVASYGTPHTSVTAFFSTSDGGNTWVEHLPPAPTIGPMDVVSSTTWFAVVGKALYLTTNGGTTWSRVPNEKDLHGYSGTGSLDFVNTLDGWTILGSGRLWHTSDGGRAWKLELLPQ